MENRQNTSIRNGDGLNKLGRLYEKYLGRLVPRYAALSLVFCLLFNCFVFYATKFLLYLTVPLSQRFNMETAVDKLIPMRTPWITVYIGSYLFWALNFILASREGEEHWFRCWLSHFLGLLVCFFAFLFLPSTMYRPEITDSGIFAFLTKLIYTLDQPTDLFPSIHCLASWYCFMWIRKSKKIHISYKIFSFIFAVSVFASTMFVKQHCFVDFVAGVAVSEIAYIITRNTSWYKFPQKVFSKLDNMAFKLKSSGKEL